MSREQLRVRVSTLEAELETLRPLASATLSCVTCPVLKKEAAALLSQIANLSTQLDELKLAADARAVDIHQQHAQAVAALQRQHADAVEALGKSLADAKLAADESALAPESKKIAKAIEVADKKHAKAAELAEKQHADAMAALQKSLADAIAETDAKVASALSAHASSAAESAAVAAHQAESARVALEAHAESARVALQAQLVALQGQIDTLQKKLDAAAASFVATAAPGTFHPVLGQVAMSIAEIKTAASADAELAAIAELVLPSAASATNATASPVATFMTIVEAIDNSKLSSDLADIVLAHLTGEMARRFPDKVEWVLLHVLRNQLAGAMVGIARGQTLLSLPMHSGVFKGRRLNNKIEADFTANRARGIKKAKALYKEHKAAFATFQRSKGIVVEEEEDESSSLAAGDCPVHVAK